mgnify:CR=1 FL=1
MPPTILTIVAVAAALAWLPILWKFLTTWKSRKNPISLAIAASVTVFIYGDAAIILLWKAGLAWTLWATVVLNALACFHFYLAFFWARKRFPDARPGKE